MVPGKKARRAIGGAFTTAVVDGLRLYGPHAMGLLLFAFITLVCLAALHFGLGVPLTVSVPGAAIVALSAVIQKAIVARRGEEEEST